MLHAFVLTVETISAAIAGLWLSAYATAGLRYLLHGKDIPEVVDAAFITKYSAQSAKEGWAHRILVALDICTNVFLRGNEDETMSGRSYRASLEGKLWGRVVNYWLSLYQVQHGIKALIGDLTRAKARVAINLKVLGI